jgi:hypothetical protein
MQHETAPGFPAWRFGPNGEESIFTTPEQVPAGWQDRPFKAADPETNVVVKEVVVEKVVDVSNFDHNKDGRPGGSTAPEKTDRLKELRAEYQALVGKRAFPGWDEAEIERRMAAHKPEPEIDTTEF